MKYYLVALFDEDSYSKIEEIQRNLCRKYKLYKNLPMLHITLEVVENPDMDKLDKIINDIIKPYKKFRVEINGAMCFNPPYKAVTLKIENMGYIMRLSRQFNDKLKLHGFEVRDNIQDWDLHVSLASPNFSVREWSPEEYVAACETAKMEEFFRMARIERIELWKPVNNKKDMLVKSFPLKDF